MNYHFLLLLGLLFALLVSPPPLVGATVTIYKFKGEDVDDGHVTSSTVQTGVDTLIQCALKCGRTTACGGFSWDKTAKSCTTVEIDDTQPAAAATSKISVKVGG